MYKEAFIKSWKDLKNNLLLFLPDIVIFLMNLSFGLLFLKYSGLIKFLTDPEMLAKELEELMPVIKLFIKENLLKIIISLALFVLTSFLIGSGLLAMRLGMMKQVIKNEKLTIKKMIDNGKHVWQVVAMKMVMFVIGITAFLFISGTGIILSTFIPNGYVIVTTGLLFPLLILLLQLLLFFRYQIMFMEKKHTVIAVKESFEYFKKYKKHVFTIWLIIFAVSFITTPLNTYLGFAKQKAILVSATIALGYLASNLVKIIVSVWSEMYKFRSYARPLKP